MNFPFVATARALFLALVAACAGCDAASRVSTVVLATKGGVSLVEQGDVRLVPGQFVVPPATIRTGSDGAVALSPVPGILIRLDRDSELALDEVALHKRGEDVKTRLVKARLMKGRAQISVDEFKHGTTDFRFGTAAGDLTLGRPVLADVIVSKEGEVQVICASGDLLAAGVQLPAGKWFAWSPGSERPVGLEAAENDKRWSQLLELRRFELQLTELQERQRDRIPGQFPGLLGPAAKN